MCSLKPLPGPESICDYFCKKGDLNTCNKRHEVTECWPHMGTPRHYCITNVLISDLILFLLQKSINEAGHLFLRSDCEKTEFKWIKIDTLCLCGVIYTLESVFLIVISAPRQLHPHEHSLFLWDRPLLSTPSFSWCFLSSQCSCISKLHFFFSHPHFIPNHV
jgi:hypothetical protein